MKQDDFFLMIEGGGIGINNGHGAGVSTEETIDAGGLCVDQDHGTIESEEWI